jgi:hypothetical protein
MFITALHTLLENCPNLFYVLNTDFKNLFKNIFFLAGHWWLTRVILATQEAEIRRLMV